MRHRRHTPLASKMKNPFRTVAPASSPESVSCLPVVTAILPARNEGQHIGQVLAVLRAVEAVRDILVVDDGSTDDTVDQVEQARVRHLTGPAGSLSSCETNSPCPLVWDEALIPDWLPAQFPCA